MGLLDAGLPACSFQHSDVHFASQCQREVLRTYSQEGRFSWGPQHQQTWVLGDFTLVLEARGSGHCCLGALGILVPSMANQKVQV